MTRKMSKPERADYFRVFPHAMDTDEQYEFLSVFHNGILFRIMKEQWKRGSLPADRKMLAKIVGVTEAELAEFEQEFPKLEAMEDNPDRVGIPYLFREWNEVMEFYKDQKDKAIKGGEARKHGGSHGKQPHGDPTGLPTGTPPRLAKTSLAETSYNLAKSDSQCESSVPYGAPSSSTVDSIPTGEKTTELGHHSGQTLEDYILSLWAMAREKNPYLPIKTTLKGEDVESLAQWYRETPNFVVLAHKAISYAAYKAKDGSIDGFKPHLMAVLKPGLKLQEYAKRWDALNPSPKPKAPGGQGQREGITSSQMSAMADLVNSMVKAQKK